MTVILEYPGGAYLPLGQASSLDEARLMLATHLAAADPNADELPARAAVWQRDPRGNHVTTHYIRILHE